jgi:imidazoleglycerol phosphate synthase glutamine amidotransferase subunit HisH
MIALIDYGMGNLGSVANALRFIECEFKITSDPKVLSGADAAILPGVGAFGDCMGNLRECGLVEPIRDFVASDWACSFSSPRARRWVPTRASTSCRGASSASRTR